MTIPYRTWFIQKCGVLVHTGDYLESNHKNEALAALMTLNGMIYALQYKFTLKMRTSHKSGCLFACHKGGYESTY